MKQLAIDEPVSDLRVYEKSEEVKRLPTFEVAKKVLGLDCPHLVITGGEPLIQQEALTVLLKWLMTERKLFVEVETNGTIRPRNRLSSLVSQWNVSPKLTSAGNGSYASEKPECFETFKKLNSYFKFVIQREEDLADCERIIRKYCIPKNMVVLMPEATSAAVLEERGKMLSEYCQKKGYKFSTRLQILLYGNVRGK